MNIKQIEILEMIFGLSGFALFWYATTWVAALGLFLVLFANNIKLSSHFTFLANK